MKAKLSDEEMLEKSLEARLVERKSKGTSSANNAVFLLIASWLNRFSMSDGNIYETQSAKIAAHK